LTEREAQVLNLLRQGKRAGTIAGALHLSKRTVYQYSHNIREKLDAASTYEVIAAYRAVTCDE
jgi:DNA-binding NarL/FixJ family response regulator